MILDPTDFPSVFSPGEMLDTSLCLVDAFENG